MQKTFQLQDLVVGMYIASPGAEWVNKGLYPVEGLIATESDLQFILRSGSLCAVVDLERSDPKVAQLVPAQKKVEPKSTKEELAKARATYTGTLLKLKEIMEGMREGVLIPPSEAEPMIESVVESLDRNTDALLGLCKLREVDEYTYTHCVNVSVLSVMFAKRLGIPKERLKNIGLGGLFHDLGKSKIPLSILNAPRKLSDKEFSVMKLHPTLGYDQLKTIPDLPHDLLNSVIEHHERLDGAGYPKGLSGEQISQVGFLVGIADIFDAITTKRPYKEAMPLHHANSILYGMRGKAFPKELVDSFIQMIGIYPLGSPVKFENKYLGVISGTTDDPIRPKVIILRNCKGHSIMQREIDLREDKEFTISSIITEKELGCDITSILGIPTARKSA